LYADHATVVAESNENNNESNIIGPYIFEKKEPPVFTADTPKPLVANCTPQGGSNGLYVSWSSVPYAAIYKLIAFNSATLQSRTISNITDTYYTDRNLSLGTEYRYTVSGVSATGSEGPLSATVSARVPAECRRGEISGEQLILPSPGNPPPGQPPPPEQQPPPPGESWVTVLQGFCLAKLNERDDRNNDRKANPGETVTWTANAICTEKRSGYVDRPCANPSYNYRWTGDPNDSTPPLTGRGGSNDTSGWDIQRVSYPTIGLKRGSVFIGESRSGESKEFRCEGFGGIVIENPVPPDFALRASPSTIYIERFRGGSLSSTNALVSVDTVGGFDSNVSLSATVEGRISAEVESFNFGDHTLNKEEYKDGSSLSVTLRRMLPDGNYRLTVTGEGGGKRRSAEVQLQVVTIAPVFEEF
jgi:hypothetical protein